MKDQKKNQIINFSHHIIQIKKRTKKKIKNSQKSFNITETKPLVIVLLLKNYYHQKKYYHKPQKDMRNQSRLIQIKVKCIKVKLLINLIQSFQGMLKKLKIFTKIRHLLI